MCKVLNLRHGAAAVLTLILVLTSAGCGTRATTAPESTNALDNSPGEVIIPENTERKLHKPKGFLVQPLGGCIVALSWTAPDIPCDAVLYLDGEIISRQSAGSACYLDMCGKTPGPHTYELRYSIGAAMGPVDTRVVMITRLLGEGRGNGREPGPEQG